MTLTEINQMSKQNFTEKLGDLYEHSPWIAATVADQRPFATVECLLAAMQKVLEEAHIDQQINLIRAHPELAGREAIEGQLTIDSLCEQVGAGLNQCTSTQLASIQHLNRCYQIKFGWPFVIAVAGLKVDDIIVAMQQRLDQTAEVEHEIALQQINRIAALRLIQRLSSPYSSKIAGVV